ncbi:MAG: sugar phosphate isomerase/epimerase family protein [bacterium]
MDDYEFSGDKELNSLGFRLEGFKEKPLQTTLQTLSRIGYRSVEICLEHPELAPDKLTPANVSRLVGQLKEYGLRVSSVSCHGRKHDLITLQKRLKAGMEIVRDLGTRILVVGTVSTAEDCTGRLTFNMLEDLLKAAEDVDVIIAVEPEPETVLDGMYEFSTLACRMIGAPLGLNLDVGHAFLTEGNVVSVIREWAPFIVHTHLEDMCRAQHVHLLPGDGHLDLRQLVSALREHDYCGDLTLDLYDITDDPEKWAEEAMLRCRKIFV